MNRNKLSLVIVFAFLFAITTLTFQNCSKVEFAAVPTGQSSSSIKQCINGYSGANCSTTPFGGA